MKKTVAIILILGVSALALWAQTATEQQQGTIRDEDVRVNHFEDMNYPPLARQVGVQGGVVVVRAILDEQGIVTNSVAISGSRYLIPDALANAKKWRFQPNANKAVVIVYNFRVVDGLCNTLTSQFTYWPPNLASVTACQRPIQP